MKSTLTTLAAAAALFIGLSGPVQAANDTVFFRKSNGWDIYSTKVGCVAGQPFTNDTILILLVIR